METVVITGASGHLGANLARQLAGQGRQVRALVRSDRRAVEGLDVACVQGDIRDPDSLRRAFAGAQVVYHSAAYISLVWDDWPALQAINIQGVQNVIEACRACGVQRLVHFSSVHALTQEPVDIPLDEDRPLVRSNAVPPYDRSKAAGERLVRQAIADGLDALILYPTGIIGPYDFKPSHLGEVLLSLARGRMFALVDAGFDWVDARDVAEAALRAEAQAPTGARYLLSGERVPIQNLASMVAAITGVRAPRLVFPLNLSSLGVPFANLFRRRGSRPLFTAVTLHALRGNLNISHARASRDLEYRPRPIEVTLRDTLDWFNQAGYV